MIRTISIVFFMAVFAVSLSFAEQQEQQTNNPSQQQSDTATQAQSAKLVGVIDKVDVNTKTIFFKEDGSNVKQEVAYNESTSLLKGNAPVKIEELKSGDRVLLEIDTTNTITRLELQPAAEPEQPEQKR